MLIIFSCKLSCCFLVMKFSLDDIMICVSNSINDDLAMERKWIYSFVLPRPHPSAILDGIEIADRRNWLTRVYFSTVGNDLVIV